MYQKQDPGSIRALFAGIARRYDLGNAINSMQLHRRWNRTLVEHIFASAQPKTLLDLCCGTGDIAFTYLNKGSGLPETVFMIDFCEEMLVQARAKAPLLPRTHIHYIVGDAQDIPLPDASVDAVTIAYGIRNVAEPIKCISEVYRVLKPGGRLGILELTRPSHPVLRFGHALYLRTVVPIIGRLLTANRQAYEYLQSSILNFIPAKDLQKMMQTIGFNDTQLLPLSGGIATIIAGTR